jgi:hypothetical protein
MRSDAMDNPVTNRLRLIEMIQFEGLPIFGSTKIPWFDQAVPMIEGISQEVFRGENHLDSVHPGNQSVGASSTKPLPVKARKGDIIYRVSLIPQPYDFTGIITTKDGYQRMYEVSLQLLVNSPRRCVENYRASKDPASLTIGQFKTQFELYFSQLVHDEIDLSSTRIGKLNQQLSDLYGIIVVHPNWRFHADPRRKRELEIQQKTELRKKEVEADVEAKVFELRKNTILKKEELKLNAEVKELEDDIRMRRDRIQKQFDHDEKVKQNDFVRVEKIKGNLNEARIKLLSTTVNDLATINTERIRDAFDSDASVRAVLEYSLKLLAVFTEQKSKSEEVIDSTLLNDGVAANTESEEKEPITDANPIPLSEMGMNNNVDQASNWPLYPHSSASDSLRE